MLKTASKGNFMRPIPPGSGPKSRLPSTLLAAALAAAPGHAEPLGGDRTEWSQWRGPSRDGRSATFLLPSAWPGKLKEAWKVTVGEGHSSPILHGGRLYLAARQGDEEAILCIEPGTGKTVWRAAHPAPYEMHEAAVTHGKGPKSTLAAGGGKVFALGISGTLTALDAATGAVLWRREFSKKYPKTSPLYGAAMSPVLEGGLCIAHVGGHDRGALTAFEAESGNPRWSWEGDGPGYASPIVAELAGRRQVVTQSQTLIVGVDAASGELLWKLPLKTPYDQNSVTPVLWKDRLILSGLDQGILGIDLRAEGGKIVPREAWRVTEVSCYMSTPVVVNEDVLFGMSHRNKGQLFVMDPRDGKVSWKGDLGFAENASFVGVTHVVAVLTEGGELHFVVPSAKGLEILAKHAVASSPTWAHPLLAGKRIWIKDRTSLAAFDLE